MIYPNWLYYPDDDLELFIDTVQQTSYVASTDHQEYIGANDGKSRIKATPNLPTATFECTWDTNHIKDIYRYLEYLRGKEVILAFGPQDLASYAKIVEASVPWTIGTVQKASISVQFIGAVRGQFREAEDSRNTLVDAASTTDSDASGGVAELVYGAGDGAYFTVEQSDILLPKGDYIVFARVRDNGYYANAQAAVSDDVVLSVQNVTDSTSLVSATNTISSKKYQIFTADFTIDKDDIGDEISIKVTKGSQSVISIAGLLYDFLGFVAKP